MSTRSLNFETKKAMDSFLIKLERSAAVKNVAKDYDLLSITWTYYE